jgi:phosphoserine phosphatase
MHHPMLKTTSQAFWHRAQKKNLGYLVLNLVFPWRTSIPLITLNHMQVLTFVTPNQTLDFDMWIKKSHPEIVIENRNVLEVGKAVQWIVKEPLKKPLLDTIRAEFRIDVIAHGQSDIGIRLFMADMDATIVVGETLDDMAEKAGIGDKISDITKRAMAGELDFEEALVERVGLLSNLSTDIVDETLSETGLNEGAEKLLSHLKSKGVYCVLISGGFTQFTSKIASQLGFDANFGNELIIENDIITGQVKHPILDKNFKREKMDELARTMDLNSSHIMAVGDGENDLPMLQNAGIGIGYYPKPVLKNALTNTIEYTDLSTLKYCV